MLAAPRLPKHVRWVASWHVTPGTKPWPACPCLLSCTVTLPLPGCPHPPTSRGLQANEILHHKLTLNGYLAEFTGQGMDTITADTDRDFFMSAQEAVSAAAGPAGCTPACRPHNFQGQGAHGRPNHTAAAAMWLCLQPRTAAM